MPLVEEKDSIGRKITLDHATSTDSFRFIMSFPHQETIQIAQIHALDA
jgi:hypothetical protein